MLLCFEKNFVNIWKNFKILLKNLKVFKNWIYCSYRGSLLAGAWVFSYPLQIFLFGGTIPLFPLPAHILSLCPPPQIFMSPPAYALTSTLLMPWAIPYKYFYLSTQIHVRTRILFSAPGRRRRCNCPYSNSCTVLLYATLELNLSPAPLAGNARKLLLLVNEQPPQLLSPSASTAAGQEICCCSIAHTHSAKRSAGARGVRGPEPRGRAVSARGPHGYAVDGSLRVLDTSTSAGAGAGAGASAANWTGFGVGQLHCRLLSQLKPQNNMSKSFNAFSAASIYAAYTAVFPVANATGESLFSYAFESAVLINNHGVRHGLKTGGAKASKLLKIYCKF